MAIKLKLGADIGGTNTCIGVISSQGKVVCQQSFSTCAYHEAELYADAFAQVIKAAMANAAQILDGAEIEWLGLGIGAPNGNFHNGSIQEPPNLNFKGITPLVALLEARLKMPRIALTNDANAAAVGEHIYGAAQGFSDFIMITLGTGLGSGIFVNNQLVYGHSGLAGELGHMTVIPDGRNCGFGRRGSLENYCSATGIRRTFFEMLAQHGGSTSLDHKSISAITAKDIADAAIAGDSIAMATMDLTGDLLGQALASFALVTSPSAFFLFGGPVQAGDVLLAPLRQAFERHLIPTYKGTVQIIASALPPGEAAILGAAALLG